MVEVEPVDALAIHLPIALLDEPAALAAQELEVARRHAAVDDEEAVLGEAASVLARDLRCGGGHAASHVLILRGHRPP